MGDSSKNVDVEQLIAYSDDLVRVLKDKRDINSFTQCLEHSKSLRSSCDSDFNQLQSSLQGPVLQFSFLLFFLNEKCRFVFCFSFVIIF